MGASARLRPAVPQGTRLGQLPLPLLTPLRTAQGYRAEERHSKDFRKPATLLNCACSKSPLLKISPLPLACPSGRGEGECWLVAAAGVFRKDSSCRGQAGRGGGGRSFRAVWRGRWSCHLDPHEGGSWGRAWSPRAFGGYAYSQAVRRGTERRREVKDLSLRRSTWE